MLVAACLVCAAPFARPAANGLKISPPAITNDAIGKVTLICAFISAYPSASANTKAKL